MANRKYLNGYDSFKLIPVRDSLTGVTFDLRYMGLTELVEEHYIEHELLNGDIVEKFQYAHYFWELDYSALAEAESLLKFKAVLNDLANGTGYILYPHKDIERYFFVTIARDKLTLGRHYGGINAGGEKDFKITFRTKYAITDAGEQINWVGVTDLGAPLITPKNEYSLLSDESNNYITTETGDYLVVHT